jgi:hypothetical protein
MLPRGISSKWFGTSARAGFFFLEFVKKIADETIPRIGRLASTTWSP